jgi:polyhydroxyalkanoate synthesis regulator phasin
MVLERIKRISSFKAISAGLAIAMVAGLLAVFGGQASAARNGAGKMAAKGGCLAVLMTRSTVSTALSELVKDGTITQAQADAIQAKIGADSGKGAKACLTGALLKESGVGAAVQTLLGINLKEIRADIKSGQSLTEIAQSKGVDRAKLVSTIETAINTELDKLVTNGKMSADRAATLKTEIATLVEKAVDAHTAAKTPAGATPIATPAI